MPIDIDTLSEPELIDLNHRIVHRLRFLQQARAHMSMMQLRIGDRVAFTPDARGEIQGTLVRYNKRTVTVVMDDGHRWNVAPGLLRLAARGPDAGHAAPARLPAGDSAGPGR